MKKFIFMFVMAFMTMISVNAQTALQTSKLLDNTYVGGEVGVATPLDFNSVFPLNTTVGIHVGKWFNPVFGTEVEGTAWLGSNHFSANKGNTFRASYVGVNSLVNWSNLLFGYNGTPRFFEFNTIVGTGWLHHYNASENDYGSNYLGLKTGFDFAFNLGKSKAHTISVRPSVLWNLSNPGNGVGNLAFNKLGAQLYLGVGYTYHFKTSNGTHYFKIYDIGALNDDINGLRDELAKKPKEVTVEKIVTKEVPATVIDPTERVVYFSKNSDVLTDAAKTVLDKINGTVKISAYASPEGTDAYNKALSQRRADAVKSYLEGRGVTVTDATGYGVDGEASNRVAVVAVNY